MQIYVNCLYNIFFHFSEKSRFFFKQVINYKPQTYCGEKVVSVCVCSEQAHNKEVINK